MPLMSQYEQVRAALITAGPTGIHLNSLRSLIWPESAPQNWRVILAMRVTRARKNGMKVVCENSCYRVQTQENTDGQVAASA